MSKKVLILCPLCQSDQSYEIIKPRFQITDPKKLYGAANGITGTQRIVKCLKCEFIYENPRLPIQDIIKGYQTSNDADHDSQHKMRVRSFLLALNKNKKFLPPPSLLH